MAPSALACNPVFTRSQQSIPAQTQRFDGNFGAAPNYEPNSFNGPVEDPAFRERPRKITGSVDRHNHRLDSDYYTQPGDLFRLMNPEQRERLIGNIVASTRSVPEEIQNRQIQHFLKADPAYGAGVARGLGRDIKNITMTPIREEVAAD